MQGFKERLFGFLFPAETDIWLAILRLGLGIQTTLYSLTLRNDWNDLLGGAGRGVSSKKLNMTAARRSFARSRIIEVVTLVMLVRPS